MDESNLIFIVKGDKDIEEGLYSKYLIEFKEKIYNNPKITFIEYKSKKEYKDNLLKDLIELVDNNVEISIKKLKKHMYRVQYDKLIKFINSRKEDVIYLSKTFNESGNILLNLGTQMNNKSIAYPLLSSKCTKKAYKAIPYLISNYMKKIGINNYSRYMILKLNFKIPEEVKNKLDSMFSKIEIYNPFNTEDNDEIKFKLSKLSK